ncbi:uncharacterized protein METZ01_LOCUS517763, partial [marine metagenome]
KRYENFPVASYVLSKSIRPHINTFYSFSRTIDDIADSNTIDAKEKIDRLSGFENAIIGKDTTSTEFEKAHNMRRSLEETGVTEQHCIDLIQAFKQDATKLRYQNWDELIGYCQLSAAPVGRYLLDLHGESTQVYTKSDALCNALQILNHLQDCKQDYLTLNRVYLPIVWLAEKGLEVNCLNAARSVPELKEVFLKILNSTEDLLQIANKLPRVITNKRLAIESNSIL